jgi:hypothetical protein
MIVFAALALRVEAQKLISEIPLPAGTKSPVVFSVGDSLLLTYKTVAGTFQWRWVDRGGQYSMAEGLTIDPGEVMCVKRKSGNEIVFYLSSDRQSIRARIYQPAKKEISLPVNIPLGNKIIGAFVDSDTIQILSYERKEQLLIVAHIFGGVIRRQTVFDLPIDIMTAEIGVVSPALPPGIRTGSCPVKIYKVDGGLRILIDEILGGISKIHTARTILYNLSFSDGSVRIAVIIEPGKNHFISALGDSLLYRCSMTAGSVVINTHRLDGALISGIKLKQEDAPRGEALFIKRGRAQKTEEGVSIREYLQYKATRPSLVAERDLRGRVTLVVGDYYDDSQSGSSGGAVMFGLVGGLVGALLYEAIDGPGVSAYYYIQPDAVPMLSTTNVRSLRSQIDRYEMSLTRSRASFRERFFVPVEKGVIGFYFNSKTDKVNMLEFSSVATE